MSTDNQNCAQLARLRAELARLAAQGADTPRMASLRAQILAITAKTPATASCPYCGRAFNIPPCDKRVKIGCKVCRNVFYYDPLNDAITLERGAHARTKQEKRRKRGELAIILLTILGGAALIAWLWYTPPEPAAPALTGDEPKSVEEIERELKALSE